MFRKFLKNTELHIRASKINDNDRAADYDEQNALTDPDRITTLAKDFVTHTAVVVGCAVIAMMIVNAGCQVVINASKK